MIGYIKNKESFYSGDVVNYNLEKAVSLSGGTYKHFNIFKELLTYSSYNTETKGTVHDTRACQMLLYLFPFKIKVILSLLCYQEDNKIASNLNIPVEYRNVLLPSQQIGFSNLITNTGGDANLILSISRTKTTI
jgi:hypothetical protein